MLALSRPTAWITFFAFLLAPTISYAAKPIAFIPGTPKMEVATNQLVWAMIAKEGSHRQKIHLRNALNIVKAAKRVMKRHNKVNAQVFEAVDIIIEKLGDQFLPPQERIAFAMECMTIVQQELLRLHNGHPSAANRIMRINMKLIHTKDLNQIVPFLNVAASVVEGSGFNQATACLHDIIFKITQTGMSKEQKISFLKKSVRDANTLVLRRK